MTSSKAMGVAVDSGDSMGALAVSGSIVGLVLWSSLGCVTDSSSSEGQGSRSLRVGNGKPLGRCPGSHYGRTPASL